MKIELNFAVKSILIRSLRFAGLILTGIAIFLPLYLIRLSHKEHADKNSPPIAVYQPLRLLVFLIGVLVVVCEIGNILKELLKYSSFSLWIKQSCIDVRVEKL
jgi:hypothetical protein